MSNTDVSLVKDICKNIKLFRQVQYPNTKRMDFYIDITDSEDIVSKVESGKNMPNIVFLLNLSKKNNLPADYFVRSGFHSSRKYPKINEILDDMSLNNKYLFVHKLNYLKYEIFTDVKTQELKSINIHETTKRLRGKILHNTRIKHNLSTLELSKLLNRAQSTINRMENGSGEISVYIWIKISRLFHIPIDYFLFSELSDYEPSIKLVIDYLVYDTMHDLTEEQRNIMYDISNHFKLRFL